MDELRERRRGRRLVELGEAGRRRRGGRLRGRRGQRRRRRRGRRRPQRRRGVGGRGRPRREGLLLEVERRRARERLRDLGFG